MQNIALKTVSNLLGIFCDFYLNKRSIGLIIIGGTFSFIRSWFNLDREIKEAAQNVVKGCKTNPQDGFAILQGKQYL